VLSSQTQQAATTTQLKRTGTQLQFDENYISLMRPPYSVQLQSFYNQFWFHQFTVLISLIAAALPVVQE
jgi:hypothetical protein